MVSPMVATRLVSLVLACSFVISFFGLTSIRAQSYTEPLTNHDIVKMVKAKESPEQIIAKIKNSSCHFDTNPTVISELRSQGVPESILQAMLDAPYGAPVPSNQKAIGDQQQRSEVGGQMPPQTQSPPSAFALAADTPVKLRLAQTISSKDAKVDDKVSFEVLEDVKVGDVLIIQHGGLAIGTVTEAHSKRSMGRAGKLNVNISHVQLVDGEKVPLSAVKGGQGGSHTGAMTGAMVATAIVFFPAAPLFLFMHGKDITIPKGTEVIAYVSANTPLDQKKFINSSASSVGTQAQSEASGSATASSSVAIKSVPYGAEITIDGKFVGTTPSSLQLNPGDHTIVVEKSGFQRWQRSMSVTSNGTLNVNVDLQKIQ
jgi:PEGA domain-containing protein